MSNTINKRMERAMVAREKIDTEFLDATLERLDKAAREERLDSMVFYFDSVLKRDGEEVESKQIEEIEMFYCENCHANGFIAGWTKEKGWK